MCFGLHHVSQEFGHVLHILQAEHTLLSMIIFLILTYIVRRTGQNEVLLSTQILPEANFVLLYQICELSVVNEARICHVFGKLFQFSTIIFAQCRRRGGLKFIHDIFLFQFVGVCTGSCFQRDFVVFLLYGRLNIYCALLLRPLTLHMQFGFGPSSRSNQK